MVVVVAAAENYAVAVDGVDVAVADAFVVVFVVGTVDDNAVADIVFVVVVVVVVHADAVAAAVAVVVGGDGVAAAAAVAAAVAVVGFVA